MNCCCICSGVRPGPPAPGARRVAISGAGGAARRAGRMCCSAITSPAELPPSEVGEAAPAAEMARTGSEADVGGLERARGTAQLARGPDADLYEKHVLNCVPLPLRAFANPELQNRAPARCWAAAAATCCTAAGCLRTSASGGRGGPAGRPTGSPRSSNRPSMARRTSIAPAICRAWPVWGRQGNGGHTAAAAAAAAGRQPRRAQALPRGQNARNIACATWAAQGRRGQPRPGGLKAGRPPRTWALRAGCKDFCEGCTARPAAAA